MVGIYVINMDRDKERLERASQRLGDSGYRMIRVSGTDVSKEDVSMYHTGNAPKGVVGCSISHLKILEAFVRSPCSGPWILIGEDDVIPLRHASELQEFMNRVPEDFDVVHLGCEFDCSSKSNLLQKSIGVITVGPGYKSSAPVSESVNRMHSFVGAHMYIASRKGAKKILEDIKNDRSVHIDKRIGKVPNIVIYSAASPFSTTEITGLCTGSNIIGNSGVKRLFCWLDNIYITSTRTLGYALFVKMNGLVPFSVFDCIVFLLFIYLMFRLFQRFGKSRSK